MGKTRWVLLVAFVGIGTALFAQSSQQPPTGGLASGVHLGRGMNAVGSPSSSRLCPPDAAPSPCAAASTRDASRPFNAGAFGPGPTPEVLDPTNLTVTKFWDGVNWIINLLWNPDDAPFTVSYSPDPSFQNNDVTLEKGTTDTSKSVTADPGKALECFDVTGQTPVGSAVQGVGYDPEPFPTVSSVSTGTLWWGDPVTFTGTYLDPIPAANTAYMMDLPVRATSTTVSGNYATSATFTIPDDARGFWGLAQSHGRSSNYGTASYIPIYARGIGPFTNIYGINYAPSNGRFWLAADGAVRELDLFQHNPGTACPSCTTISGLTKPYVSRVTGEATPRFLYVDGTLGVTTVYQVDVATGIATPYALTHDTGFTRNIRPVGIAVDPSGAVCYIADASAGRVVSIPVGAGSGSTIIDTWGNRTFSFPDPCGIDVNVGGQVVASHTNGYIYYLYGRYSWTTYGYAGGLVHSMHFDKDYQAFADTFLFWTNELAMAEAFNRNPIGPNPAAYHGGIVFGLANGYLAVEPDWFFYVYRHFPQRVLLSNAGQSTPYPTGYQTTDRITQMKMTGWAGRKVRLRVIDPPDLSPYAPDGGCLQSGCTQVLPYEGNDNKGTTDYGIGLQPDGSDAVTFGTFTIAGDGTLTFYLKVPARYSGDNFQVEVTKCDYAGNALTERVASSSSVYTSWKRVFVERDKMFRRGNLLDADVSPPPAGQLYLARWDGTTPESDASAYVQGGDLVTVFDKDYPYPTGGFETASVSSSPAPGFFDAPLPAGGTQSVLRVYLNHSLNNTYSPSPMTFASGASAAVGVLFSADSMINDTAPNQINAPGSAFYDADMRDIEQPYDDAFVEFIGPRSGMGAVPYISNTVNNFYVSVAGQGGSEPGKTIRRQFQYLWFKNKDTTNYLHLLGARGAEYPGSSVGGFTWRWSLYCYIYQQTLAEVETNPALLVKYEKTVNDHEFGHQFRTNECATSGHDTRPAWCNTDPPQSCPNQPCLEDPEAGGPVYSRDDINRFCKEDLLLGDPVCGDGSGAVRTTTDLVKTE